MATTTAPTSRASSRPLLKVGEGTPVIEMATREPFFTAGAAEPRGSGGLWAQESAPGRQGPAG